MFELKSMALRTILRLRSRMTEPRGRCEQA
jgi:hypothetical protein